MTDPEQVERALPDDWRTRLEVLTPRLLGWAHLHLHGRPSVDAEDLVQDILCRAITLVDRYRGDSFAAWVFAIGKHVLLEHLRRRRRGARIQLSEGHSSHYERLGQVAADMTTLTRAIGRRDDSRRLHELLATLDPDDRQLALLCGMEGASSRTAAVQLGIGEEAAQKRWQRLRARLRDAAPWLAE
jgi:RNA polymerase sigma factor (sigma-70 family)